jgi:NTP pyrophosphatase (non-canonical NTP hydrolase)
LQKELGDVMWMVAEICSVYGFALEEILENNIAKLEDRKNRNVIVGEGDNR